jgi:cytochrome c biogenesis protein CcmG, thiol:disulfide interchange protein DsbE
VSQGRRPAAAGRAGRLRRAAAVLGIAALALVGCTGDDEPSIATPPASSGTAVACFAGSAATGPDLLPDLRLPCLDGRGEVSLRALAGTPTVVNLWASWCGPCKDELPAFSRLSADAGGKLRVLGVASAEGPRAASTYAADASLPFPSLLDEDGALGRGLGRRGLPVTVLVDQDGRVREVYQGAPLTDETLRALVRDKLGVDV